MTIAGGEYAAGRIDIHELEKRLEHELLLEAGRHHPVPPGWKPLPPCEHEYIDITGFGDLTQRRICTRCGDQTAA